MKDEKSYNPQSFETQIYEKWEKENCFYADPNSKKPAFCIIMPPPNVTSMAHIGHAMDVTMQDILSRYKRMKGYEVLWQPGTDHAAIATEIKIVEKLRKEGKTKEERFEILSNISKYQLDILNNAEKIKLLNERSSD